MMNRRLVRGVPHCPGGDPGDQHDVPRSTALTPNALLLRMLFRLETLDVSDVRPQR
jgi:hypothetical protein